MFQIFNEATKMVPKSRFWNTDVREHGGVALVVAQGLWNKHLTFYYVLDIQRSNKMVAQEKQLH